MINEKIKNKLLKKLNKNYKRGKGYYILLLFTDNNVPFFNVTRNIHDIKKGAEDLYFYTIEELEEFISKKNNG